MTGDAPGGGTGGWGNPDPAGGGGVTRGNCPGGTISAAGLITPRIGTPELKTHEHPLIVKPKRRFI